MGLLQGLYQIQMLLQLIFELGCTAQSNTNMGACGLATPGAQGSLFQLPGLVYSHPRQNKLDKQARDESQEELN